MRRSLDPRNRARGRQVEPRKTSPSLGPLPSSNVHRSPSSIQRGLKIYIREFIGSYKKSKLRHTGVETLQIPFLVQDELLRRNAIFARVYIVEDKFYIGDISRKLVPFPKWAATSVCP